VWPSMPGVERTCWKDCDHSEVPHASRVQTILIHYYVVLAQQTSTVVKECILHFYETPISLRPAGQYDPAGMAQACVRVYCPLGRDPIVDDTYSI
jgi:hypothetical protein